MRTLLVSLSSLFLLTTADACDARTVEVFVHEAGRGVDEAFVFFQTIATSADPPRNVPDNTPRVTKNGRHLAGNLDPMHEKLLVYAAKGEKRSEFHYIEYHVAQVKWNPNSISLELKPPSGTFIPPSSDANLLAMEVRALREAIQRLQSAATFGYEYDVNLLPPAPRGQKWVWAPCPEAELSNARQVTARRLCPELVPDPPRRRIRQWFYYPHTGEWKLHEVDQPVLPVIHALPQAHFFQAPTFFGN